eukprot:COSAG01_NODE_7857_length_3023_cov_1.992821_2_plen_280_part_00
MHSTVHRCVNPSLTLSCVPVRLGLHLEFLPLVDTPEGMLDWNEQQHATHEALRYTRHWSQPNILEAMSIVAEIVAIILLYILTIFPTCDPTESVALNYHATWNSSSSSNVTNATNATDPHVLITSHTSTQQNFCEGRRMAGDSLDTLLSLGITLCAFAPVIFAVVTHFHVHAHTHAHRSRSVAQLDVTQVSDVGTNHIRKDNIILYCNPLSEQNSNSQDDDDDDDDDDNVDVTKLLPVKSGEDEAARTVATANLIASAAVAVATAQPQQTTHDRPVDAD